MGRAYPWDMVYLLVITLLILLVPAYAQAPSSAQAAPGQQAALTTRKEAIHQQLQALAQSNLPKADQDATRGRLEQILKVLATIEETLQKRLTLEAQIEGLPKRLRELEGERQALTTRPPHRFPQVTEQWREDYEAQLHAIDVEIQELNNQTTVGELRVVAITKELEQHAEARLQLEQEMLATRSQISPAEGHTPGVHLEQLELNLQLLQAEVDVLATEREWLTKRAPLHDALLSIAQLRHAAIQQDLETIKQALETAFEQEQSNLSRATATIERQLAQTTNPLELFQLTLRRETIDLQQRTAEYRHRLNLLGEDILTQDKRNALVKQDVERMTSLVEKYASGEGIAQRLLVTFERLRLERLRYNDSPVKNLETQLQALTTQSFNLDDQLYDFKAQAEARLASLSTPLQALSPAQRRAELAQSQQLLDTQKAALREQQQVLSTLLQDLTQLLTSQREYKRLLDDSYLFILTRLFWLRDAKTLTWDTLQDMVDGALYTARRLHALFSTIKEHVQAAWAGTVPLWLLPLSVVLGGPWFLYRIWRSLRCWQPAAPNSSRELSLVDGIRATAVLVLRAALWPGYLALLAWMLGYILADLPAHKALSLALVHGLQLSALTLGVTALLRAMLQPEGWGQRLWGWSPPLCRFLRRLALVSCPAVLLLLIPRNVLLAAPGSDEVAIGSFALARLLFLTFQCAVVVLIALVVRRSSPLMEVLLARSHQRDGLLWRIWPFVHLILIAAGLSLVGLDVLGYRYAARFIWLRVFASLSVVLLIRVLLVLLILRFLRGVVAYVFSIGGRLQHWYPDIEAAAARYFSMASMLCHAILLLLAAIVILELWGFSVSWFLTSPLATQVLKRLLIVALTMGVTIVIVQMSNALADYFLQPKTSRQGRVREPSRKLRTLAPLIQTLIKVAAMFAAVLIILEQLGISTGPILAGIGIFGLAVGFASQSLIKDVINGLFVLFEDSLSVGDIVTLRGIGGQVEKITLRSVTLRDVAGTVHVIPNGSIDMIANMTKDYSRYVLDVGVASNEPVDTVIDLLRDIDTSMRQEPLYSRDMLEPIEILGLDRFQNAAMIIRARLKTRPLQQWRVGREFNRRLKMAFDDRGIKMV